MAPSRIDVDEDINSDVDQESTKMNSTEPTQMMAELKHLDRKCNDKQQWHYVETQDETPPEQVDW